MRVGIFGLGALGCLFGARLAPHCEAILFGHWEAQATHLRTQGVMIHELDGRQTHHILSATTDLAALSTIDIALVLVKSQQTARSAAEIAQVIRPNGLVLTLQNGLGNREKLTQHLQHDQIMVGTTSQGANIPERGLLNHAGNGFTDVERHPQGDSIVALLAEAGISMRVQEDVRQVIWGKLTANAGINPLTALLGWRNGELAEEPRARAMMCAAAEETAAVGRALGIELPYASATEAILSVASYTATNRSSMLQDVTRGAKTEIEAICGEIVRLGEANGVAVPVNRFLLGLIREGEGRPWVFQTIDALNQKSPM